MLHAFHAQAASCALDVTLLGMYIPWKSTIEQVAHCVLRKYMQGHSCVNVYKLICKSSHLGYLTQSVRKFAVQGVAAKAPLSLRQEE